MEQYIKGSTGLYCVIGTPIRHSGSPSMYNFCFRYHNQDYTYVAFDINEDQVPDFIRSVKLLDIKGFNVTMPCKMAVAKEVDELSSAARIIGACNTVVNENGKLTGHMTDGAGFVLNLKDQGVEVGGKDIVIFGAGGSATAIFVECALKGASSVTVFNRGKEKYLHACDMAEKLKAEGIETKVNVYLLSEKEKVESCVKNADILINATSVGMKPNDDASIIEDISLFHENLVVADIVYNPKETKLMREAKSAGVKKVINGEGMLLWQGAVAYKLYTGKDMPVEEYKKFKEKN